ncbi:MAG: nucleotide exchange factor GrpE [Lachnospiraceae bacterium]|nr:nucleotide exchange factor GrpE [Lachnospiraceae bacterium]
MKEALEEVLEGLEKEAAEKEAQSEETETKEQEAPAEEKAEEPAAEKAEEPGKAKKKSRDEKKADKKLDALKEQIADLEDRNKRQLAEFENFRKRTEKEKEVMFETGAKSVIEKILPVVDNFERGLATAPEGEGDAFAEGMKMIYKQLLTELDNMGVKPIEALGQPFDPNLHNAVMQVESDEYESGVVAQELQKGYMYRDTVVRHSMVAVTP